MLPFVDEGNNQEKKNSVLLLNGIWMTDINPVTNKNYA